MSQTRSSVLIHVVFSTKNRTNRIFPGIQNDLYAYICGICKNRGCYVEAIGGIEDHIHILIQLSRTITIADLAKEIKAASSKWMNERNPSHIKFHWQRGYGVFSVNQAGAKACAAYIQNQKERHKKWSFRDELIAILKKHNLDYDEEYLFKSE